MVYYNQHLSSLQSTVHTYSSSKDSLHVSPCYHRIAYSTFSTYTIFYKKYILTGLKLASYLTIYLFIYILRTSYNGEYRYMYVFFACMYFISSSLQFHSTVIIQTDLLSIATMSGVTPQDLLIRKWDHHGGKIVSSGYSLIHILLDSAFAIRPLKHGLRSLPHLQNIVSALFEWGQVGVQDSSGPTIHRQEGIYVGKYYHTDPTDGSLRTRLHLPR